MFLMNKSNIRKSINPAYRKHKPSREEVTHFFTELKQCIDTIKLSDEKNESEEHIKGPIKSFFHNTFYKENLINTKDRIDLAIYLGKDAKSDVGVIIEAKKPSNKGEFLTDSNLNKKALQELLLYYLRERLDNKNNNLKHLITTNGYEWFLFKAEDFYTHFFKNRALIKEYEQFRDGLKDTSKNELFYTEIASKYIAQVQDELPFVHIDFSKTNFATLSDAQLNIWYKVFSNIHLLGHSFGNDSNKLNGAFYLELLHIIGLEEIKDKGKKIIDRKPEANRDYASLLENTIFTLEDKDHLPKIKSVSNDNGKAFNAGLELCLTWINRVLFLKLLESQLLTYHKGAKEYKFLQADFINGFDDLNDLFFSALARKAEGRHAKFKERFKYIPYLNSSLFERNELETEAFEISALKDEKMQLYPSTVLKDTNGKRMKGKIDTLSYLFQFLDAFDFATDGTEGITDDSSKTLINASVLGLIFEKINGYKDGSFYTPAFITMYMCKETLRRTITQKFKEQINDQIETFDDVKGYLQRFFKQEDTLRFNQVINGIKICDPAVGSGHFLVSALNELIAIKNELGILADSKGFALRCEVTIINDELYITDENGDLFVYNPKDKESQRIQETLFTEKQTLIENCLFGVDINPNSVKICRLRLWIELLKNAYYKPNTNELETLPNIDINIKCGNSLISRFGLDADLKEALKKSNLSIEVYKNAVNTYRNAESKEQKREMETLIEEIKTNFSSSYYTTIKENKDLANYRGQLINLQTANIDLFGAKLSKSKVEIEERRLKLLVKQQEKTVSEIIDNKIFDNAFEWRFEFPDVLNDDGDFVGFDAVIGNPPYGVNFSDIEKKYLTNFDKDVPDFEIYIYFTSLAKNILNESSLMSFIFPNTFLSTKFGKKYRDKLFNAVQVYQIVDLSNDNTFEDASVRTCIFSFRKNPNEYESEFIGVQNNEFLLKEKFNKTFLLNETENLLSLFYQNKNEILIIAKLRKHKELKEYFEVSQGYIPYRRSDLVKKYGITEGNKIIDERLWHSEEKRNEDWKKEILGKNINRYSNSDNFSYVFYGKHVASYVNEKFFKNSRILVREITGKNLFCTYIIEEYYNNPSLINIINEKNTLDLKYCLAILNSSLIGWLHNKVSPKANKGLFPKILINDVRIIPLAEIATENQQPFIEKVNEILALKQEDPKTDTSALEKEIDAMVYELYGLTAEEIKIVEES